MRTYLHREDICISRKYSNSVTNNLRLSLDSRLLRLVCFILLLHFLLESDEGVDGLAIYLFLLLVFLLEDVVGGVNDGLHRLAVVLLLAVAEVQGALAAHLQFRRIFVMKVVKKRRERLQIKGV